MLTFIIWLELTNELVKLGIALLRARFRTEKRPIHDSVVLSAAELGEVVGIDLE